MKCDTAIDLVVDSLMDRLDHREQAALEEHLASCAECAAEADRLGRMWQRLGELTVPSPGSDTLIRFGRELERTGRRSVGSMALRAAAAIALLFGGAVIGRLVAGSVPGRELTAPSGSYLLVIRGTEPDRRADGAPLLPAYRAWERNLEQAGILIAAEKLRDDGGRWVSEETPGGGDPGALEVRGFFLIEADSYQDAVRVAQASPHVAFGGTIEVRAIQR